MIYKIGAKYKCVPGGVSGIRGYCFGPSKKPCPGHVADKYDKANGWVSSVEHSDGIWIKQIKETQKPTLIIEV